MFRIFSLTFKHIAVTHCYDKNSEKVGSRVNKLNTYSVHTEIWTHLTQEKYVNYQPWSPFQKGVENKTRFYNLEYSLGSGLTRSLGLVIMHFFQNQIMWASVYDYMANPKTLSLFAFFSKCPIAIAQGLSKCPGPLYRSKIKVSQSTPCGYSKLVSQDA